MIQWIRQQNWDDYIKEQLVKKANKCPVDALEQFGREIELHIVKIRKLKREKDEKIRSSETAKEIDERREGIKEEGEDSREAIVQDFGGYHGDSSDEESFG